MIPRGMSTPLGMIVWALDADPSRNHRVGPILVYSAIMRTWCLRKQAPTQDGYTSGWRYVCFSVSLKVLRGQHGRLG